MSAFFDRLARLRRPGQHSIAAAKARARAAGDGDYAPPGRFAFVNGAYEHHRHDGADTTAQVDTDAVTADAA